MNELLTLLKQNAPETPEKFAPLSGGISTATHFMMKTYKQSGIIMHTGDDDERLKVSP